jgi:putative ABC transport system permease protein
MTVRLASIAFALRQHKAVMALMVLGASLTMAVVANAVHVVVPKWQLLRAGSGLDETCIVLVQAHDFDLVATHVPRQRQALEALAAQPGVVYAATVGAMAFVNDLAMTVSTTRGARANVGVYYGSPRFPDALGLRVIAGSGFDEDDFVPFADGAGLDRIGAVLVTQSLAQALFGSAPAVGATLRFGTNRPVTIKGVVDDVLRPRPSLREPGAQRLVVFAPIVPDGAAVAFVVRAADPAMTDQLARTSQEVLLREGSEWSIERAAALRHVRDAFFDHEVTVVEALLSGSAILASVTLMGLVGLSHAWVARRRRSIGIRRALGATRASVLSYFLVEITLVMGIAASIGAVAAIALGRLLAAQYGLAPITPGTIGMSAVAMIVLGWIAVLAPALAASRVSPREAMDG